MPATVDTERARDQGQGHVPPGGQHLAAVPLRAGRRLASAWGTTRPPATVPRARSTSFAGVGYFFDLAALTQVRPWSTWAAGRAWTPSTLPTMWERRAGCGHRLHPRTARTRPPGAAADRHVEFLEGRIESLPLPDASVDCVISNGVINLAPDKNVGVRRGSPGTAPRRTSGDRRHHHREAPHRGDRLQRRPLGVMHRRRRGAETYLQAIESAGFTIAPCRVNAYAFLSDQARNASARYGVKSARQAIGHARGGELAGLLGAHIDEIVFTAEWIRLRHPGDPGRARPTATEATHVSPRPPNIPPCSRPAEPKPTASRSPSSLWTTSAGSTRRP